MSTEISPDTKKTRLTGILEVNLSVLLMGGTAQFSKLINLPAASIILYRSIVAFIVLCLLAKALKHTFAMANRKDLAIMLISGVLLGAHWVTYFHSMQISTIAVGVIALYSYSIMIALLEPVFFKEKLHKIDIFLALLVFFGIILLVPEFSFSNNTTRGVAWGLLSAFLWTLRLLLLRKLSVAYSSPVSMSYQVAVISILLMPVAFYSTPEFGMDAGLLLILLGIFFTAAPHALIVSSLNKLKAKTVAFVSSMQPVYATLFAMLILGEFPPVLTYVGGAIIIFVSLYEAKKSIN